MGTFAVEAKGYSLQEAWKEARKDKEMPGSVKDKKLKEVKVPKGQSPRTHATKLLFDPKSDINDSKGPVGCILVTKGKGIERKQASADVKRKSGAKKWKTVYFVVDTSTGEQITSLNRSTKTKCIKAVKDYLVKNQDFNSRFEIHVGQELVSHKTLEAKVWLEKPQHRSPHTYLFFGRS